MRSIFKLIYRFNDSCSRLELASSIRFGLLTPVLESWAKKVIAVSSMGKQSTGKKLIKGGEDTRLYRHGAVLPATAGFYCRNASKRSDQIEALPADAEVDFGPGAHKGGSALEGHFPRRFCVGLNALVR